MSEENKAIDVKSSIVIKKSPNCRQVAHKTTAGLSEEEAIERHTIGNFGDEQPEEDETQS
jgi:hypothetical protein